MRKIFVRSPYFIEIDEATQTGAKVELYIWRKGETTPTTPSYTLSQNIASQYQTNVTFNISPYALDYIQPVSTSVVTIPVEEAYDTWCYIRVVSYWKDNTNTYTELDDITYVALNSFTLYEQGYNQYSDAAVIPLFNTDITLYNFNDTCVSVWIDDNLSVGSYTWERAGLFTYDIDTDGALWKLNITESGNWTFTSNTGEEFNVNVEYLCEPKYTPVICTYVNRYGGWQYLTFFKANRESLETEFKDFNLMPSSVNYNVLKPVISTFNQQGKKKITVNTGWVDENYFELIEDLMLSQTILLDGKPVYLSSKSTEKKTYIKDKNINYTIEFNYAYGVINDII